MALVNRWYQLLQQFISHDRLTIEALQQITDTTAQTVKKTIQLLNEQLDHTAKIVEVADGYQLKVSNVQQFEGVMNGSLRQQADFNSSSKRIAVLIDCFMKQDDYVVIDDLAELIGVSRSTVNKDLRKLKEVLASFGISLTGTPNKGLLLGGEEENLRLLYLYHAYDYLTPPELSEEVLPLIDAIAETKKLDFRTAGLLKKVIALTLERIHAGKNLSAVLPYYINYFGSDPQLEELWMTLEINYSITISQLDFDFLCFPLNIFNNNVVEERLAANPQVSELFHLMMQEILASVLITVEEQELFNKLRAHFMFLVNRIIFHVQLQDIFDQEFRNKHAFSCQLADLGVTALADFLAKPKQESEIAYLAIYFELALKDDPEDAAKEIAVVCNTGKGTALMIKRQLVSVLGSNIQITHYSEEDYRTQDLTRYFAIFTTIPLPESATPTTVIKLNDLFNDKWLLGEWKRIIASKATAFENTAFSFATLDATRTYEDNLSMMLDQLINQQLADTAFKSYILKKSREESAVLENGIAFPHGINPTSSQIVVSIGSYKNGQSPEGIELVFLVAIPADLTMETEAELLSFYDTIFVVSADQNLRKKMQEVNSREDYAQLLASR
ncbi:BglG family transcription antiterminator [Enterococcus sp. AZ109]|uniref:BglG family transcription antiterminator n=1 Tax=Enterococcus sp. AZ109 TaxID=2774634 RepID=UPI003F279B76